MSCAAGVVPFFLDAPHRTLTCRYIHTCTPVVVQVHGARARMRACLPCHCCVLLTVNCCPRLRACVLHRTCRATCLCLSAALTCCMPSTSRGHRSTRLQNPPCRLWLVHHPRFSSHHVPPSHTSLCAVQSVKEDLEMIREFTEYSAMMEDVTQRLRSEIEQLKLENQSYALIQLYLAICIIHPSSSNHFVFACIPVSICTRTDSIIQYVWARIEFFWFLAAQAAGAACRCL